MLATLLLSGCGSQPETPAEQPGKLAGVIYDRTVGMERGSDFHISIGQEKILSMEYFDTQSLDYIEVGDIPLEEGFWESVETTVMQMWPMLEEKESPKEKSRLRQLLSGIFDKEPTVLDGGDRTDFSLVWETGEGTVTVAYRWDNSEPLYYELATLLKALAPQ